MNTTHSICKLTVMKILNETNFADNYAFLIIKNCTMILLKNWNHLYQLRSNAPNIMRGFRNMQNINNTAFYLPEYKSMYVTSQISGDSGDYDIIVPTRALPWICCGHRYGPPFPSPRFHVTTPKPESAPEYMYWIKTFVRDIFKSRWTYRFGLMVLFMVFNATFNNISVISWQSVLLVEETGVPEENHRSVTGLSIRGGTRYF